MTLMSYGRATPTQMDMLCLAGGVFRRRDITTDASDDDRIQSMRVARAKLVRKTGADFGYDLQSWHTYLLSHDDDDSFGYRHSYAWSTVRNAIQRFIRDPDRRRLLSIIEAKFPPEPGKEWDSPIELPPPLPWKEAEKILRQAIPPSHESFTREGAPPCPQCGQPLRTPNAKQCFRCGADWH
jgi:hypothetical protein